MDTKQEETSLEQDIASQYEEQLHPDENQPDVTPQDGQPQAEALDPIAFPEFFKKDYESHWGSIPREMQEYLSTRYSEQSTELDRRNGEFGNLQSQYEQLNHNFGQYQSLLQPFEQSWAMQGMNPVQGLQSTLAYAQALQANPAETISQLAQMHGVDLQQLTQEQPYTDPGVQALQKEIGQLKQQLNDGSQQQQAAQQQAFMQQIQSFEKTQDEQGNPKYPHFQNVLPAMVHALEMGSANTLADAYEFACQYSPDIQAELQKSREAEQAKQRQADAEKAKKAAKTVSSTTVDSSCASKTLEEEIGELYEQQVNS